MYATVITEERSRFVASGLTYWSDTTIAPGTLVDVPLRKKSAVGIVLTCSEKPPHPDIDVRPITNILRAVPILTHAQIQLLLWMCEYYCCTPRHALQVFLPQPPWRLLADDMETIVERTQNPHDALRGPKQRAILDFLAKEGPMEKTALLKKANARATSLATLQNMGCIALLDRRITTKNDKEAQVQRASTPPALNSDMEAIVEKISAKKNATTLLCTDRVTRERLHLFTALAWQALQEGKSAMLLLPTVAEAENAAKELGTLTGGTWTILLVHGKCTAAERRRMHAAAQQGPRVIIGTKTALFVPVTHLGIIMMDREHDRSWKNEQTPRYHARLVAEALARLTQSTLVLSSANPSLDTLRHAIGTPSRVALIEDIDAHRPKADVRTIDLTEARFGSVYPFTTPLIERLREEQKIGNTSILLLNRRGTGSALLCFHCKRPVANAAGIAHSVITRHGKPWLIEKTTGEMHPTPDVCPSCGSAELRTVGAGTERAEAIARSLFPDATIVRVDSDTVNTPAALAAVIKKVEQGEIDILLGTQTVLAALQSARIGFVGVLVADQGLSFPDFRAGERIFAMLSDVIAAIRGRGSAYIQTFRPEAPEIKCATAGTPLVYLTHELSLRNDAGYPPFYPLIDILIRNDERRAHAIANAAKAIGSTTGVTVTTLERGSPGYPLWVVRLKGLKARDMLRSLPLANTVIDVDPVE